jgi:hypothetical protein
MEKNMTNVTNLEPEVWVDDFTLELFANFSKGNIFNANGMDDVLKYLTLDAEEFIEVVDEHFTGYSCDHSAESIAKAFLKKYG